MQESSFVGPALVLEQISATFTLGKTIKLLLIKLLELKFLFLPWKVNKLISCKPEEKFD